MKTATYYLPKIRLDPEERQALERLAASQGRALRPGQVGSIVRQVIREAGARLVLYCPVCNTPLQQPHPPTPSWVCPHCLLQQQGGTGRPPLHTPIVQSADFSWKWLLHEVLAAALVQITTDTSPDSLELAAALDSTAQGYLQAGDTRGFLAHYTVLLLQAEVAGQALPLTALPGLPSGTHLDITWTFLDKPLPADQG